MFAPDMSMCFCARVLSIRVANISALQPLSAMPQSAYWGERGGHIGRFGVDAWPSPQNINLWQDIVTREESSFAACFLLRVVVAQRFESCQHTHLSVFSIARSHSFIVTWTCMQALSKH